VNYQFLEIEENKGVGIVRLNRPPANALNVELVEELHSVVDEMVLKESIRALMFIGKERFFAGGADIKMMQEHKNKDLPAFIEGFTVHLQRVYNKIEEMPKPVVAAINGFAAGGGCELALACDFRFMAKGTARVGLPEIKLGLLPGAGGLQRLPRLVGKAKAMEMIVNGLLLNAEEALEVGLVHKIFEPGALFNKTFEYAEQLAKQATLAVGTIKKCINKGLQSDIRAGLAFDIDMQDRLFKSEDAMEGIAAFIEKRTPFFKGK
jgi:enoyl-CoA hydratase